MREDRSFLKLSTFFCLAFSAEPDVLERRDCRLFIIDPPSVLAGALAAGV